jgi:DNA-binding IscR family transcriptional regulator
MTLAELILAVECPVANVRGVRPEAIEYPPGTESLRDVWIALRANLRAVLEAVTLADLANGSLPEKVRAIAEDPEAWQPH